MTLRTTRAARQDLIDIFRWSRSRWGNEHAVAFLEDLLRAMARLEAQPKLGPSRDDLGAGMRALTHRQHVVYYLLDEAGRPYAIAVWHAKRHRSKARLSGRRKGGPKEG